MDYSLLVGFRTAEELLLLIPCSQIKERAIVIPIVRVKEPPIALTTTYQKPKWKRMLEKVNPLGDGYFVVSARQLWGESFIDISESYNKTIVVLWFTVIV